MFAKHSGMESEPLPNLNYRRAFFQKVTEMISLLLWAFWKDNDCETSSQSLSIIHDVFCAPVNSTSAKTLGGEQPLAAAIRSLSECECKKRTWCIAMVSCGVGIFPWTIEENRNMSDVLLLQQRWENKNGTIQSLNFPPVSMLTSLMWKWLKKGMECMNVWINNQIIVR